MSKSTNLLWGIDLGGTKIEGVVINNRSSPEVLTRKRIPTESAKGYKTILGNIKKLIDEISNEIQSAPLSIGIGTPGTLDPNTGLMKNSNSTSLNNQRLKSDLEALLGIEVILANDANCFALAETKMGIVRELAPDASVVFGVIMGTGVGGGLVVESKVINGKQGIGGEWGHIYLDESGGDCYCGKKGCVETILSGPALERYYETISGEKKGLKEILKRHEAGTDPNASQTIDRLISYFGLGISTIINIIDPDIIVIGGGVGNIDLLYKEGPKAIKKNVFDTGKGFHTIIAKPKLGDSAGVFGAAFLTCSMH